MHFTKVFLLPMLINSLMWKSGFVPKTQNSHISMPLQITNCHSTLLDHSECQSNDVSNCTKIAEYRYKTIDKPLNKH